MDHATEQKNRRKDVINDPRERNMRSNESHGRNMLGEKQVVWQDQRFRKY